MSSHALSRRFSPPPPPPPPKENRPTLQTTSPVSKPIKPQLNTQSPVRRKPLPASASFSPVRGASATPTSPPQQRHVPESSSVRSPPNGTRPIEYPNPRYQPGVQPSPQPQSFKQSSSQSAQFQTVSRQRSKESTLSKSTSHGTLPRISADEFPVPPAGKLRSNRSNGALQASAIIEGEMGLMPAPRPAPLRTDSNSSTKSYADGRKPQTPTSKFTAFFSRRQTTSPSTESAPLEASDHARSPMPSPNLNSPHGSNYSVRSGPYSVNGTKGPTSQRSQDSIEFEQSTYMQQSQRSDHLASRCALLEAELREICVELAGSIKREMDLEDTVERLQTDPPSNTVIGDRTSDYFSDSGTSSIRPATSEYNPKEEVEKIKRESEQQRAQLRVDLSQKWQQEVASRRTLESHVQSLEQRLSQSRHENNGGSSAKAKELEMALEDSRRRLNEERQIKENFEDLLTALKVELEQHRNDRDNLRDEVVPQLKSRIEGLEASLSEAQKSPYDLARMQHELQSLRDENSALNSARMMNAQIGSVGEDENMTSPRSSFFVPKGVFGRSNSRAGGLARSGSVVNRVGPNDLPQNVVDHLKAVELQKDALHSTVKYLLRRQEHQTKQFEKRAKIAAAERERPISGASDLTRPKKGGYEKEVRGLRSEINLLRKRADDALEQKWQCEKGLAGLKMDLDRSKQETESLTKLLQVRDNSAPEVLSSTLESALKQLEAQRQQFSRRETLGSIANEQKLADQLEESAERSEALSSQVKQQLQTNSALRTRLKEAIAKGERDQHASAEQINVLQSKLRKLEDVITSAQIQSETAVMKHEEEIRVIRASHNTHLMRTKSAGLSGNLFSPTARSPLSPMFSNSGRSPRLDKTTTGPGMALHQALKTEYLEHKVAELEKALSDAEKEMGQVVGRMNTAQIGVAELEAERDDALRQTRRLEAAIAAERVQMQRIAGA